MYIDLDIESEISQAVADYLADGGDRVITYEEYDTLMTKLADIERELKEMNFWKADRNHNHKELEEKIDKHEKNVLGHGFTGF